MVDVWWARPVDPAGAPHLLALLDAHERARIDRFRRPADQARYLGAHALARLVLGSRLGLDPAAVVIDRTCRCGEQHGKPRVPGLEFSLTHSGDRVGVAVSAAGPVGLDVEELRDLAALDGLAEHALSPAEPRPPDGHAFLRVWTRKEALLKATGEGLSSPMNAITLAGARVVSWSAGPAQAWLVDLHAGPDHPAALAGLGTEPPEVRVHEGDPLLH
ncbi:4'-phosphopantetheinyl transferase family protein [Pseudonocardia pini]|uniref:4'-phosphopantetheinyl transferase family protein n=1 Tax=Pseudonocardia pini TaxID=2758030 RepID=UPI0015EFFB6F|nr:4'-phosphopantetheinyl transferase superfamily protein [Pseudonocardia pini]